MRKPRPVMRDIVRCLIAFPVVFLLWMPCKAWCEADGPPKPDQGDGYGPKTEEERTDAELIRQEDERELQKTGEPVLATLEGKLYLQSEINGDSLPWVVGRFAVKGRAHLLVLDNPELFKQLQTQNAKDLKLSGRIRLGGKYFIATSVYTPVRVPSSPPKRGGM